MFYQASTTDAQLKSDLYGGTVEDRQNEDFKELYSQHNNKVSDKLGALPP